MPLDEECSRYVKDNYDLDSYKDVVLDEQVYGFPLYSYETLGRNPDTGEYDTPLYVRVFLSLGNYALQNKQGTKLYRAVVSFAQELSHIYRDKNII